jgi:fatty-acyl-CoA synthase
MPLRHRQHLDLGVAGLAAGVEGLARLLARLPAEGRALFTILATGVAGPERPDRLLAVYRAFERYGPMGAALPAAAARNGDRLAVVDERGALTFSELDRRSNAVANAMRARGLLPGASVAILCRNHRGIFDATFGVLKAGGRAIYLNTDFAGPQATEVCAREGVQMVVYDEELAGVVGSAEAPRGRFVAWHEGGAGDQTLEALIAAGNPEPPPAPTRAGDVVILTSGTTGTPKGATRSVPRSLVPVAAILSRIPFRAREATFVASPVHHAWGFGMSALALGLGSTLLLRRRFDPDSTLVAVAEHRATGLVVVPVMLSRLVDAAERRAAGDGGRLDLSSLRIVASSGSQLPASLATRAMDAFGEVVYNLYGSTEVAWATIATPRDLREAPGTAGRPPPGTTVRVYDDEGRPVPPGATGRIFVGSGLEFGGYTDGGSKEAIDGLIATGDVGHFDEEGRLYVDGRDDEMIVSGGENVFPAEVEGLLSSHPAVAEAAAVGVDDEEFGQRLRAFVVVRPGFSLSADEVKDHVRANLARYKVPRDVVFVEALPRNPSGKVLKRELAAAESR